MATEILTNGGTMRDVADVLGISESIAGTTRNGTRAVRTASRA